MLAGSSRRATGYFRSRGGPAGRAAKRGRAAVAIAVRSAAASAADRSDLCGYARLLGIWPPTIFRAATSLGSDGRAFAVDRLGVIGRVPIAHGCGSNNTCAARISTHAKRFL